MKYLINVDRLTIKLKQGNKTLFKFYERISLENQIPFFLINKRIHLERINDNFRYYYQVYKLTLDNRVFCHIKLYPFTNPGSSLITLSIPNYNLYRDYISDLTYILLTMNLTLNNISYLDICLDSQTDYTSKIKKLFLDFPNVVLVSSNKIKHRIETRSSLYNTGEEIITIYIGSNKSDKQVVSYNKTEELKEKDKPYLKEIYQNEFGNNNVYRIEVRLNNTSFVKYNKKDDKTTEVKKMDIDILKLNDTNYLVSIFSIFFNKLVDFRKRTNNNISRCEKIQLIDFGNVNITPLRLNTNYQLSKIDDYREEKKMMKKYIRRYNIEPSEYKYELVMGLYHLSIKPVEVLKIWYDEYIKKNNLKIIPQNFETEHISLFDYKLKKDRIHSNKPHIIR